MEVSRTFYSLIWDCNSRFYKLMKKYGKLAFYSLIWDLLFLLLSVGIRVVLAFYSLIWDFKFIYENKGKNYGIFLFPYMGFP